LIFYHQVWGESNAAKSFASLDLVSILLLREESKIFFVRVINHNIVSEWKVKDGYQIAMYYSQMFGLFGQKSHSHFSRASRLDSYSMKPNTGLVKIYRLSHVLDAIRNVWAGGFHGE